jgi:mono/diheme cytochrome c family protein
MNDAGSIKIWVLVFIVAFGIGTTALVGLGCALGANQCPFIKHKALTTTNGMELYQSTCIGCHGALGQGGRADAPPLRSGDAATLTLEQIEAKVANGKPFFMPAYSKKKPGGTFTDAQIRAVSEYVISLRQKS